MLAPYISRDRYPLKRDDVVAIYVTGSINEHGDRTNYYVRGTVLANDLDTGVLIVRDDRDAATRTEAEWYRSGFDAFDPAQDDIRLWSEITPREDDEFRSVDYIPSDYASYPVGTRVLSWYSPPFPADDDFNWKNVGTVVASEGSLVHGKITVRYSDGETETVGNDERRPLEFKTVL